MALTYKNRTTDAEVSLQIERLMTQRSDVAFQTSQKDALRGRIAGYEAKYGIRSADLHSAIDDGRLIETQDICRWIAEYDLLAR